MDELKEVRFANNPRTSTDYPDTCGGWNLEGIFWRVKIWSKLVKIHSPKFTLGNIGECWFQHWLILRRMNFGWWILKIMYPPKFTLGNNGKSWFQHELNLLKVNSGWIIVTLSEEYLNQGMFTSYFLLSVTCWYCYWTVPVHKLLYKINSSTAEWPDLVKYLALLPHCKKSLFTEGL